MSLKDETSTKFVKDDDMVVLRNGVVKGRERSVSPVRVNPFLMKDKQDRGRRSQLLLHQGPTLQRSLILSSLCRQPIRVLQSLR